MFSTNKHRCFDLVLCQNLLDVTKLTHQDILMLSPDYGDSLVFVSVSISISPTGVTTSTSLPTMACSCICTPFSVNLLTDLFVLVSSICANKESLKFSPDQSLASNIFYVLINRIHNLHSIQIFFDTIIPRICQQIYVNTETLITLAGQIMFHYPFA